MGTRRRPPEDAPTLTRRQAQVMRAVHALGEATVADVRAALDREDLNLTYAAVKSALRGLVREGRLRTQRAGRATVYAPTASREAHARSALADWVRTFFRGNPAEALVTFLDAADADLPQAEIERIRGLLERPTDRARKRSR